MSLKRPFGALPVSFSPPATGTKVANIRVGIKNTDYGDHMNATCLDTKTVLSEEEVNKLISIVDFNRNKYDEETIRKFLNTFHSDPKGLLK